ncbi:hypothetical protein [Sulfurimonas sp.]|uniref:hypothetical protein n=1 Tax=Sulfurimonas sp. TaxID=2022749 RepID=UPI0025CBB05D|nr:hypothetical protein [Sulfurimonas sp.]
MKKAISIFFITQVLIISTYFYSSSMFANIEVAFLSAFLVIAGASLAYKKMVDSQLRSKSFEEKRDILDEIEDPHELYDDKVNDEVREGTLGYVEINEANADELDLKTIVKEEKAKIKTFSVKSMKYGARGTVSLYRIAPYIFLILSFIALKNNELLDLRFYLPSLALGIVVGSIISKKSLS